MDSIPHLSLGTAILVIFVACAGFVLLRGITKVLIGTVILAISAWLGFLTWQIAPTISVNWFGSSIDLIVYGLPILVFVAAFVGIRVVLSWISSPFGEKRKDGDKPPRRGLSLGRVIILLVIALLPTFILLTIGVGVVHHTASVEELRDYATRKGPAAAETGKSLLQTLKTSIEEIVPKDLLKRLDPLADSSRLTLAKLVTAQSKPELEPVIDPATGKPIPRAIIVEDPELDELARAEKFGTLLRHPVITKALEDPAIRKLIADLDPKSTP